MSEILNQQYILLRIIEKAVDNFKKIGKKNYTAAKIRSRMASLKDTWAQCVQIHASLLHSTPAASREAIEYFKAKHFENGSDLYQTTLDFLADCLEEVEPPASPHHSTPLTARMFEPASSFSVSHLPPINLPQFSGQFDEWENFRDKFKALIIDNENLSAFSRMHFLASSLSGRALDAISGISVTADNFDQAWTTLTSRFENRRRLADIHVSSLLNLPTVCHESSTNLNDLRNHANHAIASLKNLHASSEELLSTILIFSVSQKLDTATRRAWRLHSCSEETVPSYDDFDRFLSSRVKALEDLPPSQSSIIARAPRTRTSNTASVNALKCCLCHAAHYLTQCAAFKQKNAHQRLDVVRRFSRCINCLSSRHAAQSCPSKYACRSCSLRHHSMLHDALPPATTSAGRASAPPDLDSTVSVLSSTIVNRSGVLLATARVRVGDRAGRSVVVRALLDQGSELSFISERLCQLLKLRRIIRPVIISAVGGVSAGSCRHAADVTVAPIRDSGPSIAVTASVMRNLTRYLPSHQASSDTWSHLGGLRLADPEFLSGDPIDLLIGADVFGDVVRDGLRRGGVGQPIALRTIFGWILTGPASSAGSPARVSVQHCSIADPLDQELRRFWETEDLPARPLLTRDEQQCEDHFTATHSRLSTGRYVVRLPFKSGPPIDIGGSRWLAERSLRGLHRRFKTRPDLQEAYTRCLQEYIDLGHMHSVPTSDPVTTQAVYIPHLPVIREDFGTSRLRVVFNASSRSSNASSLNDHLLTGPKLQTDLSAVILRWRTHRFVMSADISKMYRQILVDPRDRVYQRILWSPSEAEPPAEYSLATVTFGTSSAPFIALRVLRQLMEDEGRPFPLAVAVLRNNTYVDDLLFGADDLPLLVRVRDQIRSMLRRGHFELGKWTSNSAIPLRDVCSAESGLIGDKILRTDHHLKILGISWNPDRDSFFFTVKLPTPLPQTKRSILSTIAKIFDPLGWGTPVTILAKIFMQRLWLVKLDWDDPLAPDLADRWAAIHRSLAELNGLGVPRWTGQTAATRACEMHGFCDASSSAYAAVVYLRAVSAEGGVTVSLMLGKAKVAPVKTWSIPRLELAAATLLARLMDFCLSTLHLSATGCHCWSDSTVVLAWLAQHPSRWTTFVANRVSAIQTLLPSVSWRHVPSRDNPADCASRGVDGGGFAAHALWWTGPGWLSLEPHHWPSSPLIPTIDLEERGSAAALHVTASAQWDLASRYSSWSRLLRVTAYIMRFIDALRRRREGRTQAAPTSAALSSDEFRRARVFWIRQIQSVVFPLEVASLNAKQPLSSRSALLSLSPFLDDDGIIRVGGRLQNASMPFSARHPIVLAGHPVVTLLVRHTHLSMLHAGLQLSLASLRREYWILRARSFVRSIIHNCIVCVRERSAVPEQLMGSLPDIRVTPPARAFLHCGIDYAGPVSVRALSGRGHASRKAYIAIFICMASRAAHLELVDGYTTAAFIAAFSRFCSRRGYPSSMYSDNGTTFRGAARELALAFRAAVRDPGFVNRVVGNGVSWHFIPPSAPHFGGLWEAGVRSTKYHLKRVVGSHALTFEEFTTLLCNVEACLNSRPIAPLTDGFDDMDPLTPGHFLIGSPLTAKPEPSVLSLREDRLSRWQRVQQMTERFWKLWSTDYLHTLQQRGKWRRVASHPVRVGQLVLLRTPGLPPCQWDLGRVVDCHPGADGLVRVVSVRTSQSSFVRPISRICPLPVDCSSNDTEASPAT